ncbi:hypothetical protein M2164_004806 [Streptomyces sp. SAI-208]|nr:hypothetical protein [Streptomyces sp. SAI-208]
MPSTVRGRCTSSPAAASAAAPSSAYPRTASARARGASTSWTTASVRTPRVPSLPQKDRATSAPFSGSRASSAYPEIRRGSSGKPVLSRASSPSTSSRSPSGAPAQPCPSRSRSPRAVTTSSRCTLSAVVPHATECDPQELFPIIPPSVHRPCVEGSGPNRSPCGAAASWSRSRTSPGCTTAVRLAGSRDSSLFMCRVKSSTTPVPVACPAMEVPPPRATTGTPCERQTSSAAATSSASAGATTPSGTRR